MTTTDEEAARRRAQQEEIERLEREGEKITRLAAAEHFGFTVLLTFGHKEARA